MIDYHPKKTNIMENALSCKNKVLDIEPYVCDEKELLELRKIDAKMELGPEGIKEN
jgi:hypothetical protein